MITHMITLRNKLYESLLDNEVDLVNNGDNTIISSIIDKIFRYKNLCKINKNGLISYNGSLLTVSTDSLEEIKKIFSGDYLTEYEYFKNIEITGNPANRLFASVIKKPIYIDKIGYLYLYTNSLDDIKSRLLNIKNINSLGILIFKSNLIDWQDVFRNTNINEMYIDTITTQVINKNGEEIISNLSGLTIKKLIIDDNLFSSPLSIKENTTIEKILANNNIKHLYITTLDSKSRTKFNGRNVKVIKIK